MKAALAGVLALVLLLVLLPNTAIRWLRMNSTWINQLAGSIELMRLPFSLVHLVMFSVLGFLLRRSFRAQPWLRLFALATLFAVLTEVVQWVVPGREARWADVAADLVGLVAGFALATLLNRADRTEPPLA